MKRRSFIKSVGIGAIGVTALSTIPANKPKEKKGYKNFMVSLHTEDGKEATFKGYKRMPFSESISFPVCTGNGNVITHYGINVDGKLIDLNRFYYPLNVDYCDTLHFDSGPLSFV